MSAWNIRVLGRALKFLALSILLCFIFYFIKDINYQVIRSINFLFFPLLISALLSFLFRYWGVVVWKQILINLGALRLPHFSVLSDIHAKAWMSRYLPGGITWMIAKVYFARNLGISKSRLTISTLTEAGIQIIAVTLTALTLLLLDPRLLNAGDIVPVIIAILVVSTVLALLLTPTIFRMLVSKGGALLNLPGAPADFTTDPKASVQSLALYSIGSIISGLSYFFIVISIWPQATAQDLIYVIVAVNLAGVAGMITPFLPGGIGVRDATLLVLLAQIMPKEIALAVTVFSRIWSIAIDVIFFLFAHYYAQHLNVRDETIA